MGVCKPELGETEESQRSYEEAGESYRNLCSMGLLSFHALPETYSAATKLQGFLTPWSHREAGAKLMGRDDMPTLAANEIRAFG